WDGTVLGCCVNHWGAFGNAFRDGLTESLNSPKLIYAREMLLGQRPARPDIPCTTCPEYRGMVATSQWVRRSDVERPASPVGWAVWAGRKSLTRLQRWLRRGWR